MKRFILLTVLLLLIGCGVASANTDVFPANGEWYVVEFDEYDEPIELIKTEDGYKTNRDIKYSLPFYLSCSSNLNDSTLTITTTTIYRGQKLYEHEVYRYIQLSADSWMCYTEKNSSLTKRDMVYGFYFENVINPNDPFDKTQIYEFSTEISSHQRKYLLVDGHIYPKCNQYDQYYFDGTTLFLIEANGYLSSDFSAHGNDAFLLKSKPPFENEEKPFAGSFLFIRDGK